MHNLFKEKQTDVFDSQFKANTLVGNWYEERCNPQQTDNFHFFKERKANEADKKPILTEENFQNSSSNWLNFQNYKPDETFKTEYKDNFLKSQEQKRLSVLKPFITKKGELEKNPDALNEYRQKWTKSKNVYDFSRTYLGAHK